MCRKLQCHLLFLHFCQLWLMPYTKTAQSPIQVKATAPAGHSLCPTVMTCGSIICRSSLTILHQRETTMTAVSPSNTNTHAHFHTHPCTLAPVSIKLILKQGTGFISETNGVLLANADFHVSLMHLSCYSIWHFNTIIAIPQGNRNDIRVTNTIFPSVYQLGEIMESNVQLLLELIDFWINGIKLD